MDGTVTDGKFATLAQKVNVLIPTPGMQQLKQGIGLGASLGKRSYGIEVGPLELLG